MSSRKIRNNKHFEGAEVVGAEVEGYSLLFFAFGAEVVGADAEGAEVIVSKPRTTLLLDLSKKIST